MRAVAFIVWMVATAGLALFLVQLLFTTEAGGWIGRLVPDLVWDRLDRLVGATGAEQQADVGLAFFLVLSVLPAGLIVWLAGRLLRRALGC